ncbi:MAG: hypothetical protein K2G63_06610 [Oscillospiraceae bacterium]|nr:hypothetical protein [Oscillospiraceae bacterium]
MKGTGTKTDPFIVENYDDLCNMKGGSDKCYKLDTDIDFSLIDIRKPDDPPVNVSFKELDGNNHIISNYFRRESDNENANSLFKSDSEFTLRNLNFSGIYLVGGDTQLCDTGNSIAVYYDNCHIAIKIADTYPNSNSRPVFGVGVFKDCEVLVEGTLKFTKILTEYASLKGGFEGCLVKVNMHFDNLSSDSSAYPFCGTNFLYSGLVGKITNSNSDNTGIKLVDKRCMFSYIAVDMDAIGSNFTAGSWEGVNFYDKEVMANIVDKIPSNSHLLALTTEQCKDADYLQSIDFPCLWGESV